ncbi:MFS transporter [Pseudobutyrivibrio sp. MD2005]|uniref:MFS transporter n=1 Tax=Pseudobutyrivibrio sp. MD2005 TaxID=1410616 RepID=UPI0004828A68|nr:MFS transporter [Pseudobutyrivibrio sp. MD2005]
MNTRKTTIGILSLCAVGLSYMALSPIIASISAAFPEANVTLAQLVLTLPSFLFIVCSPLSGIAMSFINKKAIALFSLACYFVGGLFPFFFYSNIYWLLAGSAIIGVGTGFLMPLINGFIVQYFDKNERAMLMGLNATFTALGALLFIFIAGQLSRFGWRYSYLVFTLVALIIVIAMICLPKGAPEKSDETEKGGSAFEMNPYIFGLFIIGIIYFIMQNSFNTNSSAYVQEIVGAGASVASLVTMVNTVGGIIGGMTFKSVVGRFGKQVETVTLVVVAIGFFLAYFAKSLSLIAIGSFFIGYGFAVMNAAGSYLLSLNTRPETNAFTVSIYLALINLGASLSPIVINSLGSIIGESIAIKFMFVGIVILLTGIGSFAINKKR